MLMKFRKKPVVIEAYHLGTHTLPSWCIDVSEIIDSETIEIETLEGKMRATKDDWIIKGVKGEVYPCKADIFAMTYERVEDE